MTTPALPDRPARAAAAILAAMALLGLIDNFVPLIAAEAGLWQFHATRSAMALAALGAGAAVFGWRLRPRRWRGVLARSAAIAVAMTLYFGCLAMLPTGQVVAGLFTAPLWVLALGAVASRRAPGPVQTLAAGVGFAGVVLAIGLVGPGAEATAAVATGLALVPVAAGLFYVVGQMGTRAWCAGEDAVTLLFWFFAVLGGLACAGLAVVTFGPDALRAAAEGPAAFVLRPWEAASRAFWLWTGVQAAGSLAGVALIVRAYQMAEAGRVAVYEYALLVFASLWAFVLFGQTVSPAQALGMALILAAAIVTSRGAGGARPPQAARAAPPAP